MDGQSRAYLKEGASCARDVLIVKNDSYVHDGTFVNHFELSLLPYATFDSVGALMTHG